MGAGMGKVGSAVVGVGLGEVKDEESAVGWMIDSSALNSAPASVSFWFWFWFLLRRSLLTSTPTSCRASCRASCSTLILTLTPVSTRAGPPAPSPSLVAGAPCVSDICW